MIRSGSSEPSPSFEISEVDGIFDLLYGSAKKKQRRDSLNNVKEALLYLREQALRVTIASVAKELTRLGKPPTEGAIRNDPKGLALLIKTFAACLGDESTKTRAAADDISRLDRTSVEARLRIMEAELKKHKAESDRKSNFIRQLDVILTPDGNIVRENDARSSSGDGANAELLVKLLRELHADGYDFSSRGIQSESGRYLAFSETLSALTEVCRIENIDSLLRKIQCKSS